MSKRSKEDNFTFSESTDIPDTVEREVEDKKDVVKSENKIVRSVDDYTDEELLQIIAERKRAKSDAVAIKSVSVPMHKLVKSAAYVVERSPEEYAVQSRLRRLEIQRMKEGK